MTVEKKRKIVAEDLYKFTFVNEPSLSKDGEKVAYVRKMINEEREYQSHIYMQNIHTGEEWQWTRGNVKDGSPQWSQDGNELLFISNRSEQNQIWLLSSFGGEPRKLTEFKNGAANPVWSPDGSKILCTTTLAEGETLHDKEGHEAKKEDDKKKPLVVDRLKYKADGAGLLEEKKVYLVSIDVKTGQVQQLTDGDEDIEGVQWSPDGSKIAYTANRKENPDVHFTRDVFIQDIKTGNVRQLTDGTASFTNPKWATSGKMLSVIGHQREYAGATLSKVWTLDVESGDMTCLTKEWDVQIGDVLIGDMNGGSPSLGAIWDKTDNGVFVQASDRGNVGIYHIGLSGEIQPIYTGDFHVYSVSLNIEKQIAVIGKSDPTMIGELFELTLSTAEVKQITSVNQNISDELLLSAPEPLKFQSEDNWSVEGWLLKPIGYKEGEKYPFVLEIHGGPHMMYGNTFFHELQLLAAEGYVVLYTNPRGSHGYGQAFVDACRGDYGGRDYQDLMNAVDYALETYDFIDENRLGVTGGSYGGFMTNWIVGNTNRFKAAVTQRSIANWLSFYGVSDIGYFFTEWEIGNHLFDNPERLWQHSPLRLVKEVETPLLILHGEKDFRCPIEQGEQLYVALKHLGKETTFVRFPDATHELSRNGQPELRIERLNHICNWFKKYIV